MQALEKIKKALTPAAVKAALYSPELLEQITTLTAAVQLPCTSENEKAVLENNLKMASAAAKVAADARLNQTRVIDDFKKLFTAAEKDVLAPLTAEMDKAKALIAAYNKDLWQKAEEKRKQIEAETAAKVKRMSNPDNIAAVEVAAQAKTQAIAAPTGVRKVWAFKVTDPAAVPAGFLMVNEAAIRNAVASGVRSIAGVEIYQDIQRTGR